MPPDLTTTNALLGIMAAVSMLEAIAVVGAIAAIALTYRQVSRMLNGIEDRHVAPAAARVNAILEDVKGVTSAVNHQAGRLDQLLDWLAGFRSHRAPPQTHSDKIM